MKHDKKEVGRWGEQAAVDFLINKDYSIVERNWRIGRAEIDIIARQDDILVIVEVKTRLSDSFADPEATVSHLQKKRLIDAFAHYADHVNYGGECRFDIIGVLLTDPQNPLIRHYEDAFFPG